MSEILTIDSDRTYRWCDDEDQRPEIERLEEDVEQRVREYVKKLDEEWRIQK